MTKARLAVSMLTLGCLCSASAWAQAPSGDQQKNMQAMVDAARKDLRTEKQSLIDQAMGLEAGEKAKFWGLYEGYQRELDKVWDTRLSNVKKYADNYQNMTDGVADELASSAMNNERQLTALKTKYYAVFKGALGAKAAARWLQAETAVNNLMMLQLLSNVPLLQ